MTIAVVAVLAVAAATVAYASHRFPDVPDGHTHHDGVGWADDEGLMVGFEDGTFRPGDPVTRGQLATVLCRQAGDCDTPSEPPTEEPTPSEPPTEEPTGEPVACADTAGAPAGATVLGQTTYDGVTDTVTDTVFDGSAGDDLVQVYDGHMVFDRVTFRGTANAHLLEVKQGGSVTVTNSRWEGSGAGEDDVQFENHGDSSIACSVFASSPAEDHVDIKAGGDVAVSDSVFDGGAWCVLANNGAKVVDFTGNTCAGGSYFRGGVHDGVIAGNEFADDVWLDQVDRMLISGNAFERVRYGAGSSPAGNYFLDNQFGTWDYRAGTCHRDGNAGATLSQCAAGPPPWYP